jgi:hypothetical protein
MPANISPDRVVRFLLVLRDFMRLNNYRLIDLFRSHSLNTSCGAGSSDVLISPSEVCAHTP